MSASRGSGRVPLSPSFAPRRLGFTNDEMGELRTPKTATRTRSNTNSIGNANNKENVPHATPLSTAKDSQYKTWLQNAGCLDLFRDPKLLSMVIRVLRKYSVEIMGKVQAVLQQNQDLNTWRIETGEPALQSIERYKLIEAELKSEQASLNTLYEEKKRECEQYEAELSRLKLEIKEIYTPKVMEHEKLLKQVEELREENKTQLVESDKKQIETYELQIEELHERLRELTIKQQDHSLPLQFSNSVNSSQFNWDYEEQEAIAEETEAKLNKFKKTMNNSISEIKKKIEISNNEQTKSMKSLSIALKQHLSSNLQQTGKMRVAEFAKLNQTLHDIHEKQMQSLNVSLSTIQLNSSDLFSANNDDKSGINEKIDKLTHYLRNLKIDQRIITLYKKINAKIEESDTHIQNIQSVQNAIQFAQESQEKLIDNSLATFRELFENELTSIAKLMQEIKDEQTKQVQTQQESPQPPVSCTLFDGKPLSPIRTTETPSLFNADSLLSAIHANKATNNVEDVAAAANNAMNINEIIDVNCNRLNEMIIKEFVSVLIDSLSHASQHAFTKSFAVIRNVIHQLVLIHVDYLKSVVFKKNNRNNNNNVAKTVLHQYKSEMDALFKTIYQNTINNVVKQLIADKMERVKIQTKISKLTLALNNKQHNVLVDRSMILQMDKISFKQIYYTMMAVMLGVFVVGLLIGFWFRSSTPNLSPSHHQKNYSFMS